MIQGAQQLQSKLTRLLLRFDSIVEQVAAKSVGDVEKAVRGSIGDSSMSGWPRGNPKPIVGAYKVLSPGVAEVTPKGKAAGLMRVLQSGRNSDGGAGGFQGPGINFRTGKTGARARATGRGGSTKGRRWNGRTPAKGTWSAAERMVQAQLGKRSRAALYSVMVSIFSKG